MEVQIFLSEKILQYTVVSSHSITKKKIDVTKCANEYEITVTKTLYHSVSKTCITCSEPVSEDADGFYECICRTASTRVKEVDGYFVDMQNKDNLVTDVMLPTSVYDSVAGGKKTLLRNNFIVVVEENVIRSLKLSG